MSNDQAQNDGTLIDATREVVITPDDAKAVLEFWKHFEIPVLPQLQTSVDKFCNEPTFENQEEIKYYICKAIHETKHEAFTDEMFENIRGESQSVSFDIEFDKQLEATLSDEEKKSDQT